MRRLVLALLVLGACSSEADGGLRVESSIARPVGAKGGVGVVYLEIENGEDAPDRLISASTPDAEATEAHETATEDGVARMLPRPEGFAIPARGRLELAPGGKHLMLYDVRRPLRRGETVPLLLRFERAGPIEVAVPVGDPPLE